MIMNKNLLFLLLFSSLQPALAEEAEPRWFKVEVIAFSYLSRTAMAQERWPARPEPLDLSKAVELTVNDKLTTDGNQSLANGSQAVAFQRLPDNELGLKADANAISRSKGRHLLLHTAWLQPTYNRQQATAVHLLGNERFMPLPLPGSELTRTDYQPDGGSVPDNKDFSEYSPNNTLTVGADPYSAIVEAPQIYLRVPKDSGQTSVAQVNTGMAAGVQTPESAEVNILDSSFTVSIGRYLHVWIDMIYREPVAISPELDGESQEFILPSYGITMHRRMRSNELHYIDHPKVSMLVKITRYELPESTIQSDLQNTDLPIATDAIPAR